MSSIAEVFVDLHVDGKNVVKEARRNIKDAGPAVDKEADKVGKGAGAKMASGFTKEFGAVKDDLPRSGRESGDGFASGFRASLAGGGGGGFLGVDFGGRGKESGGLFSSGFRERIGNSMGVDFGGIGRTASKAFLTGFNNLKPQFSKIGEDLQGAFSGLSSLKFPAIAALVPLLTSGLSALSGALVALTGALVQAGGASLALGGVFGGVIQGVLVAKVAFKGFAKAVGGDAKALAALSPAAQAAAKSFRDLGGPAKALKTTVQNGVFKGMNSEISALGSTLLPSLQAPLRGTADIINVILKNLLGFAATPAFIKPLNAVLTGNNVILQNVGKAIKPVVSGLLSLFLGLQPSAVGLSAKIQGLAERFQVWAQNAAMSGGIQRFMDRATASASSLIGIVKNLGGILRNVFGAATPAGDGLLKTFENLTKRLADFTALASTKNAIADWAQKGIDVSGTLFKGLGAGFKVIAPLFNPSILGGFFDVFKSAMGPITAVVKAIQGGLAPVLDSVGKALAENGPAIAGLFKAVAPLLKGIGSVIGQLISQSLGLVGTIAKAITPVVAAVSNFVGPVLSKFAPVIAGVILAFTNWGGAIVKVVPIIGKIIAPVVSLASLIVGRLSPALRAVGVLVTTTWEGIVTVVTTVGAAIGAAVGATFGFIKTIVTGVFTTISTAASFYFNAVRTVISTVVSVVATVISTYVNAWLAVFTTGLNAIRSVVTTVFGAVRTAVTTVVGAISGAISGAWNTVRSTTSTVFNGIKSTVTGVMSGLKSAITGSLEEVVGKVTALPGKILDKAKDFLSAGKDLGKKVIDGLGQGLSGLVGGIGDFGALVKSKINSALGLPKKISGPGPIPDFTIPGFARGTLSAPGGPALVGERGREIIDLPRGSRVYPNHTTERILASEGGGATELSDSSIARLAAAILAGAQVVARGAVAANQQYQEESILS